MIYYRQCFLEKGDTKQTSWIPEEFAKLGNYIQLKQEDGTWEDGWKVTVVGFRQDEEYVLAKEREGKHLQKLQPVQRGNK